MTGTEMVVAIVAIVMGAGIIRMALRHKAGGRLSGDQEDRLKKLEARVRALEEVVGDKSYELKEKLRELER